ncbi:preprotein translocase subunit SecA [Enterobacteriaceae endosymbiont of Macroplea appendiculata]|uniref:preprotein translocase subunit SecA n=1 Tax=Enterobacteriaceae endosymbiont of Macroplea appendiculata TaxID=2675790 RepID=UPI001449C39B|nr:preprotein translocase subunit SecA [Enterobacteriaceae endosymbiont of Macroplea appendiculata]QJC30771.1 preprotein translocase subunit SecA [Enterobacteriaceae endosymbiont of Macroplea appendiculata]
MLTKLLIKVFGNSNKYVLQRLQKIVNIINNMEKQFSQLTDIELKNKTKYFKKKLNQNYSLEDILPEAFATVREASKRVFGMRHFDVQLLGGIVLHNNCIAEMRTGEGKTLTATLPSYLNSLTGNGVHIVTINDYLAKRDASNNKILFQFLDLTVGVNISGMSLKEKRQSYNADITYGTNNEYGFDFLRDNMVLHYKDKVQRNLNFAIIDEVDSILIDEARTPLIISGPAKNSVDIYYQINNIISNLIQQDNEYDSSGHYFIDEKDKQVYLTEDGLIFLEQILEQKKILKNGETLYSSSNIILIHHIIAALRAHKLFTKNIDYIVKNNKIIIVDEHTGRLMLDRRWSDGLHQAIEVKENVKIHDENHTLASITFQNFFRLYNKLSGMTGTAKTEETEFQEIYKLNTIIIPTNKPMIRKDLPDLIYLTEQEKINAIIKDIITKYNLGQPVLVGTISIEKSEIISHKLKKNNIPHNILNAKYHAKEAEIIAQAGKIKSVTIATNMAGRGTDIVLGGNMSYDKHTTTVIEFTKNQLIWQKKHKEVLSLGGLYVIGTERHESRRIDNQLRGRSGRQGDNGSSRFYLSLEDSLMRLFAPKNTINFLTKFGIKKNEAIEHPWLTKIIEKAQKKVEQYNFDIRKQLLEYDNIINDQRIAIYKQRNILLQQTDINMIINNFRKDIYSNVINHYIKSNYFSQKTWKVKQLTTYFFHKYQILLPIDKWIHNNNTIINKDQLLKKIMIFAIRIYNIQKITVDIHHIQKLEKNIAISILDNLWKEHLLLLDYLRQGIHLRSYAQKDPKQEYKREAFYMFNKMLYTFKKEVLISLNKIVFLPHNHNSLYS